MSVTRILAALMALALWLSGCSSPLSAPTPERPTEIPIGSVPEPTNPPAIAPETSVAEPTPLPRGGNLSVRLAADVARWQPWQPQSRGVEHLNGLMLSGLMRLDSELRPQPDLAAQVESTADGRVLTFTLRSGLTWHDGAPLTAEDVQFTLNQLQTLPATSTALLSDLQTYIGSVSAPTSTTVVLNLEGRYAPLLAQLTVPILPRHIWNGVPFGELNLWDNPIGSGPFRLAEQRPGEAYIFERFDRFHRGAPLLDRVALVVAPDPAIARTALAEGQLQLAELPWSEGQRAATEIASVRVSGYPENGFYFLGFNLRERRPFADEAARKALLQAIDLARLVEVATKGQGIPIGNSASPGSWADLSPVPSGANLDLARTTLEEAGWLLPEGGTIREREGQQLAGQLFVRGDDERRVVAARRIAEIAGSVGMSITVQPADFATVILARYVEPFDFDLLLGSWLHGAGDPNFGDYIFYDPDDFRLFHSSQIALGASDSRVTRNVIGFADPAYDNQAQAAQQLYALEERSAAIANAQARISDRLPYIYLWTDRLPVALSTQISSLDGPIELSSPNYLWNIERWYFE